MLNLNVGPFAVQVSHLILLMSLLIAAGVGHLAGRKQQAGIGQVLIDMVLVALVAARIVFVVIWFDIYRAAPWSILDIRDGGFTPWAGLAAGLLVAIGRGLQRPELHKPLSLGLMAGMLAWSMSGASGLLGMSKQPILPTVALKTLAGEPANLAAIAMGKPMVVNLWATWCPPCRREMPVLAAAQQQEPDVRFAFVNQGEDGATAQHYVSGTGLRLANVLLDPGTELGRAVGSSALPTTLFYNASGKLVDIHLGQLSAASLANKLNQLRSRPL